jgi:DNA-binding LacI/PurR family transcriptional regulator
MANDTVTQEHVAERAGVSRGAVSLALSNSPKISEVRRREILRVAEELGYRPNAHAAQLARHRSMTLGLVVTEMDMAVSLDVLRSATRYADAAGWAAMSSVDAVSPEHEVIAIEHLLGHRVDGVVLIGTRLRATQIRKLADQLPIVVVGRRVSKVTSVSVDDRAGARMVVEHLIDLGHRRIAHIDGGRAPGAAIRRSAYKQTMRRHNLERFIVVANGDHTEAGGIRAAARLLDTTEPPSAIFASNDQSALGVLATARDRGLDVPQALAVAGFDDTFVSALAYVNLTTVSQPLTLGAVAVKHLIGQIENANSTRQWAILPPQLKVRRTTIRGLDPDVAALSRSTGESGGSAVAPP